MAYGLVPRQMLVLRGLTRMFRVVLVPVAGLAVGGGPEPPAPVPLEVVQPVLVLDGLDGPDLPKSLPKRLQLRITASTFLGRKSRLGSGNVVVLLFGKIAKLDVPADELAAMEFVRTHTSIPVPRILEIHDLQPSGSAHIVMTSIPGCDVSDLLPTMTPAQVSSVIKELAGYLKQMRSLEITFLEGGSSKVGGVGGTKGFDHRLGSSRCWGPFATLSEFHTHIRFGEPVEDWVHEPDVMAVHQTLYTLKFTHADIHPGNIRVDPKTYRITGIVDWEFAGWYPEYWEYTKMFYGGERPGYKKRVDAIEAEEGIYKYKLERRAEAAIWLRAGPFGYT
ncbi:kinase-like domain-containing protein [Diplogelasinospora grovesii]|uniref:Kinase-like domain-containing protein n=1 Tax=Diplogelasinospora grovesii TaxID=303347 RepID=A0AAN6NEI4_9PEZI|nr:kinase-like domain-containing protein [Diplogelasinospora grovesii]